MSETPYDPVADRYYRRIGPMCQATCLRCGETRFCDDGVPERYCPECLDLLAIMGGLPSEADCDDTPEPPAT
jgi:hypothetical protein